MWTYHPELLGSPAPRYTSYPTAAQFGPQTAADLEAALDQVQEDEPVSLYIHIPYCRDICWYCGCNTGAANRSVRLAAYLDGLREEIGLVVRRLGGRGRIGRIAWGGGSPNALAPDDFETLADVIRTAFHCADPILSVELDPRGFDAAWAAMLQRVGVARVSLGVQTLAPHVQAAIGRVQPAATIRRAVELLRRAGVTSLNFDLMYGLPGQRLPDLARTLDAAIEMRPDRLAIFGYAHVPHLIPRQRRIDRAALPDAEARFRQAELAHATMTGAGYRAIGFDHFALPDDALSRAATEGRLRRNFQGFTEDGAEILIGLGASAISAFPDRLLQNEKNSGRYHLAIGAGRFATSRGVRRTSEDRVRAQAIEAILTQGTADLADVLGFGCVRGRLLPFERLGLVSWRGSRLTLAEGALPYARAVAATLDGGSATVHGRFSAAV